MATPQRARARARPQLARTNARLHDGDGCDVSLPYRSGLAILITFKSGLAAYLRNGDAIVDRVAFVVAVSDINLMLFFCCLWQYARAAPGSPSRDRLGGYIGLITSHFGPAYLYVMAVGKGTPFLPLPDALLFLTSTAVAGVWTFDILFDQTSFRIRGGREGEEEMAELFHKLGLSGPEDFTIPPAVYAAAMSHLPNPFRRRASLESSPPSEVPEISGRNVMVATRLETSGEGQEAVLASKLVRSEIVQAESSSRLVESERSLQTSRREVTAASEPENAGEGMKDGRLVEVDTLREKRRREVVVEATREPTSALALVVAESTSHGIEHLVSPSPNRRFRRTITSWTKGGHIGSGSFGSVYEAISDDGFFFAVKEVVDQGIKAKESIEHEVSLLSRLEHDNIVQYYGTDKEDGKLYIFLELMTQGSLAALYQKYYLQDSQVSAYTRQILNGLSYLHQRNVLHRDIKCANILIDANGLVKLADFGLAKEMSTLSQTRSSKGTVFWMAPEVAKAKPHGPPADIWSLGCTVLEMLTGKVPYPDMEWAHAFLKIGRGIPPKVPNTLSEDARDFIMKCVQSNPKDRPSAVQLLEHPLVQR